MDVKSDPFALLRELERRSLGQAAGLPRQREVREMWHGIGFRLGGVNLVAPLAQVREVLVPQPLSRVPGTKQWVAGIANVRGTLLPVFDLHAFLGRPAAPRGRHTRTLVVAHRIAGAGLIVEAVAGLRHFSEEERCADLADLPDALRPYLAGGFRQGGQIWGIFDLHRLVEDPGFMQIAV